MQAAERTIAGGAGGFGACPPAFRAVGYVALLCATLLLAGYAMDFGAPGIPPALADKDFVNYWAAAHLAVEGRTDLIFGPNPTYLAHLRTLMGAGLPWHNWSYPPHYLLLILPLALVGYKAGILLFLVATGALFAMGVRAFVGPGQGAIAALAVAPLAVVNLWAVQNGFLTAGLLLLALGLRDRRPVLAGLCLGLMSVKPQLVLLVPVLLLVERRWTVLASAAATTLVLVLASLILFGPGPWAGYIGTVLPYQAKVMMGLGGAFLAMMPSTFGAARLLGIDAAPALHLHLMVAVPVLLATLAALLRIEDPGTRARIAIVATFLATPYALNYDLGPLGAAITLFMAGERRDGRAIGPGEQCLLAGAMLLPLAMMALGRLSIPVAPPVLLATFALMLYRAGFGFLHIRRPAAT